MTQLIKSLFTTRDATLIRRRIAACKPDRLAAVAEAERIMRE